MNATAHARPAHMPELDWVIGILIGPLLALMVDRGSGCSGTAVGEFHYAGNTRTRIDARILAGGTAIAIPDAREYSRRPSRTRDAYGKLRA
jgi:hypothetical protein